MPLNQQTTKVEEGKSGVGPTYRKTEAKDKLLTTWNESIATLYDMFNTVSKEHEGSPMLGTRSTDAAGNAGKYVWDSYGKIKKRRDNLGSGIIHLGHTSGPIGIYSMNSPDWIVVDLSCSAFGFPSVSLYDTLGAEAVQYIINHGDIKLVYCAKKQLNNLLSAAEKCPQMKTIIIPSDASEQEKEKADKLGVKLITIAEVEKFGEQNPKENKPPTGQDIYTIMYTSGTTGNPKGVLLTHANMVAELAGVRAHQANLLGPSDIHMSYLPLAHSFERTVLYTIISYAGKVGFSRGIITELVNDIQALGPTFLVGAPRVWTRIHDKIMGQIEQKGGLSKKLFMKALESKKKAMARGKDTAFWNKIVFAKTKARLGGKVRFILSGSAPLDPKLGEFLKACFCCPVLEGYGLTETSAGSFITYPEDRKLGHVGAPLGCTECKLVDVSEMNYSAADGKGEICLRGPNIFKGYFKEEDKTKEVLEADGWFHTGDIGKWNENGTLSIIDRKKNIFKLAQGEYVAVEFLEGVYIRSKYVQQVWVYGNSFKRYLLAVVVPDGEVLDLYAKSKGLQGDYKTLCANPDIKKLILEDMNSVAKEAKLQGFEMVKDIHIETEPFSVDNDTMTPSFKLRRPQLLAKYQKQIDELYEKNGE